MIYVVCSMCLNGWCGMRVVVVVCVLCVLCVVCSFVVSVLCVLCVLCDVFYVFDLLVWYACCLRAMCSMRDMCYM